MGAKKRKRKLLTRESLEYLDYLEQQLESDALNPEEVAFLKGAM